MEVTMNIDIGSSVVHNTLTFLSVGIVVNIHNENNRKIFEVMWPKYTQNGFHTDENLMLSTEAEGNRAIDPSAACWY